MKTAKSADYQRVGRELIEMTETTLLLLVTAFTLGCVLTEIRWIVRMRKLQGQVSSRGTLREYEGPGIGFRVPGDANNESLTANADTVASLANLGQRLAQETPVSPLRETPATQKS
jgi:hypothetical protein